MVYLLKLVIYSFQGQFVSSPTSPVAPGFLPAAQGAPGVAAPRPLPLSALTKHKVQRGLVTSWGRWLAWELMTNAGRMARWVKPLTNPCHGGYEPTKKKENNGYTRII